MNTLETRCWGATETATTRRRWMRRREKSLTKQLTDLACLHNNWFPERRNNVTLTPCTWRERTNCWSLWWWRWCCYSDDWARHCMPMDKAWTWVLHVDCASDTECMMFHDIVTRKRWTGKKRKTGEKIMVRVCRLRCLQCHCVCMCVWLLMRRSLSKDWTGESDRSPWSSSEW